MRTAILIGSLGFAASVRQPTPDRNQFSAARAGGACAEAAGYCEVMFAARAMRV